MSTITTSVTELKLQSTFTIDCLASINSTENGGLYLQIYINSSDYSKSQKKYQVLNILQVML